MNRPAHLQHLLIDMIGGRKHDDCGSPALVQVKVELGYSCVGLINIIDRRFPYRFLMCF